MSSRKIVMSGMRPTGRLHLGNYWGALKNWIELQDRYECYFMVADIHMFTTGYEDVSRLQENVQEMVLDWLSAGLDPAKCTIFLQSEVPQHVELAMLLSMITPLSWLENNPTWKEQLQELAKTKHMESVYGRTPSPSEVVEQKTSSYSYELRTHGFLGYPVLQAADILVYGGELVPVGKDQEAHVEISRQIARRFNHLYAKGGAPVLAVPEPLLTPTPKVPGVDARKMSKSYGNAVDLFETPESLKAKVLSMYTDPAKARAKDPGNPDGCVVFALHRLYSAHHALRERECRQGEIGCVACKQDLLKSLDAPFADFRKRRSSLAAQPKGVRSILEEGSRHAREIAQRTMDKVRKAMNLEGVS